MTFQQPNPSAPQQHYAPVVQVALAPAPPKGMSIASMIIGISSVFFGWTLLVPLVGLVLGIVGLRREPHGKGFALTGIILCTVMLLGWLLVVLLVGGSLLALLGLGSALAVAGV